MFAEGVMVRYENYIGPITFVGSNYVTICVRLFSEEKRRNVCILVYQKDYSKIELFKQSEK
jgi:hypothetical protein